MRANERMGKITNSSQKCRWLAIVIAGLGLFAPGGCGWHRGQPSAPFATEPLPTHVLLANPLPVPDMDREFLWNQVVDTLDDYFRIQREERVRFVGGVLTEGRIDTYPQVGATLLEPWRDDSTPGFEKLFATLQSMRRRARVRVSPAAGGYQVEVVVFKELEDMDRPENATVGSETQRHDGTLVRSEDYVDDQPITLGWIPLGRDFTLEQQILAQLQGRLSGP